MDARDDRIEVGHAEGEVDGLVGCGNVPIVANQVQLGGAKVQPADDRRVTGRGFLLEAEHVLVERDAGLEVGDVQRGVVEADGGSRRVRRGARWQDEEGGGEGEKAGHGAMEDASVYGGLEVVCAG